ncbi:MAG: hypothetical protein ABI635_00940 [Actinomycetota bacterium]
MKARSTAARIEVDLRGTRRRRARLRRHVAQNLLDDGEDFLCPHFKECKRSRRPGDVFREGTMSHLGRRFDLTIDGRPLRVVVVGQESGWAKAPLGRRITLEARYQAIHDRSGIERRYYADSEHVARNPHMRGTTSALRAVFGKGLGTDHEGEFVRPSNGRAFHIFDGFALVNRLLCSAGPRGSSDGHPTKTMLGNCEEHFRATMSILQPTLVILQGKKVDVSTRSIFERTHSYSKELHGAVFDGERLMVCAFSRPSAHGALRWGDSLAAPYLNDVVVPTLKKAVRRL